jgi:hypothetical protein
MPKDRAVKGSRDPPESPGSTSRAGFANGKTSASNGAQRSFAASLAVGGQDAGGQSGASISEPDGPKDERSELGEEETRLLKELALIDMSKRIEMLKVQLKEAREDGPVREGLCCLQKFEAMEKELAETKTQLKKEREAKEREEEAHHVTKAHCQRIKWAKEKEEEAHRATRDRLERAKQEEEEAHVSTRAQLKEAREAKKREEEAHKTTKTQLKGAREMKNGVEEAYHATRAQLKEVREARDQEEMSHDTTRAQLKEAREAKSKEEDAHDAIRDQLEQTMTRLAAEVERRRRLTFNDVELPGNGRFGVGFPRQARADGLTTLLDANYRIGPNGKVSPWRP